MTPFDAPAMEEHAGYRPPEVGFWRWLVGDALSARLRAYFRRGG